MFFRFIPLLLVLGRSIVTAEPGYIGSTTCARCHPQIGLTALKSRMGLSAARPTLNPHRTSRTEASTLYDFDESADRVLWTIRRMGKPPIDLPVEQTVGGDRHGLSFLVRLNSLQGVDLARPTLIETRFLQGHKDRELVLSPGFPSDPQASLDTAIGRVLSPTFEQKCLTCHGVRKAADPVETGVGCEDCHGPGQDHLLAVGKRTPRQGILNPAGWSHERKLEVCAQCHSGFAPVTDPLPDDLLISSQVTALRNSECYIQSRQALDCTGCHDPHGNARPDDAAYTKTCLQCHSLKVERHAAICPVNQKDDCSSCHMPLRKKGSFEMVDHWIRVPDNTEPGAAKPEYRTQVEPVRIFLRILTVADRTQATDLQRKLREGASFTGLATKFSKDPSAPSGGYLGAMRPGDLDPALRDAALQLRPGDVSPVIERSSSYVILGRMPRDFRWRAGALAQSASSMRIQGRLPEAAEGYLEALRTYPQLLRALVFLGVTQGQMGNGQQAYGILDYAARLYPSDPAVQYNLGVTLGALGRGEEEINAYRRAIALEPDLLPAYLNLGAALSSAGQPQAAADIYRQGLNVDPLSAQLNFGLSAVLGRLGKTAEAEKALRLATVIDPETVRRQSDSAPR